MPAKPNSHLSYMSQLDIDQVANNIRQTSVGCTLGKSWASKDQLAKMIGAGMNILVINLSMVTRDVCKDVVKCIRELEESHNYERLIGITIDVTGAPVRTGTFKEGLSYEARIEEGSRITLTLDEEYKFCCTEDLIFIDTQFFPKLIHYLRKGDRIYLDEGQVTLVVRNIGFDCINCIVEEGVIGLLGSFKCVTVPPNRLNQEILYSTYMKDLEFAAECGADFVLTKFVDSGSVIEEARRILPKTAKVFTKIETRESVKNLRELIAVSDGILICRSGLAMYYTPENIFKIQKYIVGHCNVADKPVYVTGQLAESMISKPRPTRAEASDIANAVLDGVDGLLLTVETSWGMYPFDTVSVVDNVCREAERAICYEISRAELNYCRLLRGQVNEAIKNVTGASAVEAADSCGASAIFVITTTGASAMSIAMSRPSCIVIAITVDIAVAHHCLAYRGLHPFLYTGERVAEWCEDVDNRINAAIKHTRLTGLVKGGDRIIVVTGSVGTSGSTNTIHIFTLEGEHSKLRIVGSSHELSQVESPWSIGNTSTAFPFPSTVGAIRAQQVSGAGPRYSVMLSHVMPSGRKYLIGSSHSARIEAGLFFETTSSSCWLLTTSNEIQYGNGYFYVKSGQLERLPLPPTPCPGPYVIVCMDCLWLGAIVRQPDSSCGFQCSHLI
ncbi:Pyruvate kinase isozymes R/L [Echinococcus granulosus]|uniref:Pyruvate kinase n=1 Tax=Echinococcus granulosus TaxID=6210 RepID=W6UM60_ECHGR|nr:Pyruvate kinase isozymes R/L [Echinococcus granulosus]EUB62143.1 Pyruvate kinase isozymes R/L [Echinococcus granulosus]